MNESEVVYNFEVRYKPTHMHCIVPRDVTGPIKPSQPGIRDTNPLSSLFSPHIRAKNIPSNETDHSSTIHG